MASSFSQRVFSITSAGRGCHLVSSEVQRAIKSELSGVKCGLATLTLLGSCSEGVGLSVNENADPTVRTDMIAAFDHLLKKDTFKHIGCEALLSRSLDVPLSDGRFDFGTWQGVYLCCVGSNSKPGATYEILATIRKGSGASRSMINVSGARGAHSITSNINGVVAKGAGAGSGAGSAGANAGAGAGAGGAPSLCNVSIKHTSASLAVASGKEADKLEPWLSQLIPEAWNNEFFEHTYEGPDDMPGHMKSSIVGASHTVALSTGSTDSAKGMGLKLGAGCEVMLVEHRDAGGWGGGHNRKVSVTVLPSTGRCHYIEKDAVVAKGGVVDVTGICEDAISASGGSTGVCHVSVGSEHTSVVVCDADALQTGEISKFGTAVRCGEMGGPNGLAVLVGHCAVTLPVQDGVLSTGANAVVVVLSHGAATSAHVNVTVHCD